MRPANLLRPITIVIFLLGVFFWLVEGHVLQSQSPSVPAGPPASADYTLVPGEMDLSGDFVVCGTAIPDPTVASWCEGMPPGSILLGVDPESPLPANWDGSQATASLSIGDIVSPTVAVLSVDWPHRDGKGIHSPEINRPITVTWDGTPVWLKNTRDFSTFGDYYAAQYYPVRATAVLTQAASHTITFQVPPLTAWDISTMTVDLYPMPQTLHGIAYSPYRDCQTPHWGPYPTEAEIEEDMARLFHMSNGIRTYSSLGSIGEVPPIAQKYELPVCVGAWLGREKDGEGNPVDNKNREEIEALISLANDPNLPNIECAIIGNEVMLRGDLTEDELIAYIEEVKDRVDVPVTTAEVTGILPQHPNVIDKVDFLMLHIYPYWERQPLQGAADAVAHEYLEWQENYPDKRIVIGETGWPSAGPSNGGAAPGLANQKAFFYEFLHVAEEHDIEFYYFDAFDEVWKREGGVGSHWGYTYSDRSGKHGIQTVLLPSPYVPLPPFRLPTPPYSTYLPYTNKNQAASSIITVFDEYASGDNYFAPSGWMGDYDDIQFYECDRAAPYSGEVSIRVDYDPQGPEGWAGIYWQEPPDNWGKIEDGGHDLDNATFLHFYAKGETGNERIKFLMGGIWGSYPDSQQPALSTDVITLTNEWKRYTLDLRGKDLSHTIGGFAFTTDSCLTAGQPITFYLDKIYYDVSGDPGPPPPPPPPVGPYTFDVYRDKDAAGNHYVPSGAMGDTGDIQLDECWREDTHTGSTAVKVTYTAQGDGPVHACDGSPPCNWAGVYWQAPANNWGDRPGGHDLSGAQAITFSARGEKGGEQISYGVGGIACDEAGTNPYADSLCPTHFFDPDPTTLTTTWKTYTLPLDTNLDMSHLTGGFLWAASKDDNPQGATFYLDDIQYLFNVDVPLQPHSIYTGPRPGTGYDMSVDTSGNKTDQVIDGNGYMR